MKQLTLTVTADESFDIPLSTGHSLYASLLGVIQSTSPEVSATLHESETASFNTSGVMGGFGRGNRPKHRRVRANSEYTIKIGVTERQSEEVFNALLSALIMNNEPLEFTHGQLDVKRFQSTTTTPEELLDDAVDIDPNTITFTFESPVCIEEGNSETTTMFPHRGAIFSSLLTRWNRMCKSTGEPYTFDITRNEIKDTLIEKPGDYNLTTHSVLVNRVTTTGNPTHTETQNDESDSDTTPNRAADGGTTTQENVNTENTDTESHALMNIFKQGFTGECTYKFTGDGSESVKNALTTISLFAEYSGIGIATARGCGHTTVTTHTHD